MTTTPRDPAELEKHILRLVGRRWVDFLSDLSTLAAVAIAIGALLNAASRDLVSWWLSILLIAVAAVGATTRATYEVLRERTEWLRRLYAVPEIAVELAPTLTVGQPGEAWLSRVVRVMVTNESSWTRDFVATVVEFNGVDGGPEAPWPIEWRHGQARTHRLYPGDLEMINVVGIVTEQGVKDRLQVFVAPPNRQALAFLQKDALSLRINIWDGVSVQPCKDFTLTIPHPHVTSSPSLELHSLSGPATAADPGAGRSARRRRRAFVLAVVAAVLVGLGLTWLAGRKSAPSDDSAEAGFARDMAFHHAQAVEMAEIIRSRTSDDSLTLLATDIALTQQAQIGIMRGWLSAWTLNAVSIGRPQMAWSGMNMGGVMPGLATRGDVNSLSSLPTADAEVRFLQLMIEHHRGGVHMAEAILALKPIAPVANLARSIVTSQQAEIAVMTEMLRQRDAEP